MREAQVVYRCNWLYFKQSASAQEGGRNGGDEAHGRSLQVRVTIDQGAIARDSRRRGSGSWQRYRTSYGRGLTPHVTDSLHLKPRIGDQQEGKEESLCITLPCCGGASSFFPITCIHYLWQDVCV